MEVKPDLHKVIAQLIDELKDLKRHDRQAQAAKITTLSSPAIPLVTFIPGGHLRPDESITIHGESSTYGNRFQINLIDHTNSKCVFHFDFRFNEDTTVRNCNYGGSWGPEERSYLPVRKGQFYCMEIRAAPDRYLVAINGQHHSEFVHRASYSAANALQIKGEVHIASVEFRNFALQGQLRRLQAINPSIPFVSSIGGPLTNGGEIQVHGSVGTNPDRFSVNLQRGIQADESQVIALHVNPRFKGVRVIVLNSHDGGWDEEERIDGGRNPFYPGGQFMMIVRRQADHFDIFVNGIHLEKFKHRMSPDMVDAVFIEGDVIVDRVLAI